MKEKHMKAYMDICDVISQLSECLRKDRHFGAVLVDPVENVILSTGYNGYLRGGTTHCGGEEICSRDFLKIKSGERLEIGCIHAEENAIINAGRQGISTKGAWLFVNCEPCMMCARRMVQNGIKKVVVKYHGYPIHGMDILKGNGVEVQVIKC
jgi:dCMP deaminase